MTPSPDGDAPSGWTTHSHWAVSTIGHVRLDALDVAAPAGDRFTMPVVVHPDVAVALIVDQEHALALRTYRHPVARHGLELPGGLVDDGEDSGDAARREAAEETGLRAVGTGRELIAFEPLPGVVAARVHVHLFEGRPEPTGEARDPLEPGRVAWVALADVPRLAAAGDLLGAGTLVGLLAYLSREARTS